MSDGSWVPAGFLRYSERDAWRLVFPNVSPPASWSDAQAELVAFDPSADGDGSSEDVRRSNNDDSSDGIGDNDGSSEGAQRSEEVPTVTATPTSDAAADLAAALARMAAANAPSLDPDAVRAIVAEMLRDLPAPVVQVVLPEREMVTLEGAQHVLFDRVLAWSWSGLNVYLAGPPGTGKTTLAQQCAHAMGVPFRHMSCHPQMTGVSLFGYNDAQGRYVGTDFRDCYENGGLFLLDEADNGNGAIIAALNAAVENGHCSFADGIVKRHDDFRVMVAANTLGTGATAEFSGRNKLDGATLDRFVYVQVAIDEAVEQAMVLAEMGDEQRFVDAGIAWLAKVRQCRANEASANLKPRVFITPRSARDGARIIRLGGSEQDAAAAKFLASVDETARGKILAGVSLSAKGIK